PPGAKRVDQRADGGRALATRHRSDAARVSGRRERSALKVAYLSGSADLGGAERVLLMMLEARSEERAVIAPSDGPLLERARALGAEARVVAMPDELLALGDALGASRALGLAHRALLGLRAARGYVGRLRAALDELAPDLLHTNGMKAHFLGPLATRAPVVWHLHDFAGDRAVMARLLRWRAGRVARVVAISRSVGEDARAVLGAKAPPIDVVLNAVDTDRFSPGEAPHHEGVRIGLVATYARWKGHDLFLEAASKVRRADVPLDGVPVVGERARAVREAARGPGRARPVPGRPGAPLSVARRRRPR